MGPSVSTLPRFAVIGAAKSGTSALYSYLGQHPEIYLPPRQEPSFFAFEGAEVNFRGPMGVEPAINRIAITNYADYQALFSPGVDCTGTNVCGDISPVYMYWPGTAERMKRHVPEVRIIAILRNPVDRAYSAFVHARRENREPLQVFDDALKAEPWRISKNWGFMWRYVDLGHYEKQLRRYYKLFDPQQIKVILYDDFRNDPARVCVELQTHIGVNGSFIPDTTVLYNVSGVPRSRSVHRWLSRDSWVGRGAAWVSPVIGKERLRRWQARLKNRNLTQEPVPSRSRQELTEYFREEILGLQDLIERDLDSWLKPARTT